MTKTNLEIAKECGFSYQLVGEKPELVGFIEALDTYTARICAEKDAEINLAIASANAQEAAHFEQLSEAKAQLAMLHEFQEGQWWVKELDAIPREHLSDDAYRAIAVVHNLLKNISATSENIAAWRTKEQAKWNEESHSLIGQQDIKIESLRREVARLRDAGKRLLERMSSNGWAVAKPIRHSETEYIALIRLFTEPDANSSALTYEQEVKANALEEFGEKYRCVYLVHRGTDVYVGPELKELADKEAAELRASKGEVK